MTLTECKNHMRIYLNTADELGINWKRAAARWSLRYKWENERADNLQEKLDAANARAERVETAMVAMKERAERAEAALVECASSSLRLREELADVYRRAERAEAALKRAQRRAPPVGWRASFDKRGWFFFNSDQKMATPIFGTAEEAVAAIEAGRVFADLYENEFRDRSPVSGLRAALAERGARCVWRRFIAGDSSWYITTSCRETLYWNSGDGPDEGHKFCPYCGRQLLRLATSDNDLLPDDPAV